MERRLAAILAADMVAYSRLMEADEAGTLAALKSLRAELIDPQIAAHQGRIVKTTGDGMLAEFASVVDAVTGAVAIQRAMARRNEGVPEDRRIRFRVGINLGDIIIDGDDIYGDGVNIAARLEALAEPGGICVSGAAYEHLKAKVDVGYEDLGEQRVKNIAIPVRVYRVLLDPAAAGRVSVAASTRLRRWKWPAAGATGVVAALLAAGYFGIFPIRPAGPDVEPASVERMAFPLPDKPSIAVLPFDNLSGDPKQDIFVDGFTENIITALAKVPKLFVIARNSTFTYKGKPVKVQQVAEDLGVQYVLEGSVQRAGETIRITAQLIDALTGKHVWAERYDRGVKDVFVLQDEITLNILTALSVTLTEGEQARLRGRTDNLEAYLQYLKALARFKRFARESNQRARQLAGRAIELDPDYVSARVLLAWTHQMDGRFGWSESPAESYKRAAEIARKMLAVDDTNPGVHALLSGIYRSQRKFDESIAAGRKAIALAPSAADSHAMLAVTSYYAGDFEETVALTKEAMRLHPHYPAWYLYRIGVAYRMLGRYGEAVDALEAHKDRQPKPNLAALTALTATYAMMGRTEDARALVEETLALYPKATGRRAAKMHYFKNPAHLERILAALRKAGLPENPPLELPDKPSIVVLPFTNMSGAAEQEYFADGMTDDLITRISKLSGLIVISRTTAFTFKGKDRKIEDIARELGVQYVLEGSVRRAGGAVRINAQLIDGRTGGHLWAEIFDRPYRDIFALQDEVQGRIVAALKVKLTDEEKREIARQPTDNVEAFDHYLKAERVRLAYDWMRYNDAFTFYDRALALDPDFVDAHIGNARAGIELWRLGVQGWSSTLRARDRAQRSLAAALALDPDNAEALALQARMQLYLLNHDLALSLARGAVGRHPEDPEVRATLALVLVASEQPEEAREAYGRALALAPKPAPELLLAAAEGYLLLGETETAAGLLERARDGGISGFVAAPYLAAAYSRLGNMEKARTELEKVRRVWPWINVSWYGVSLAHVRKKQRVADLFLDPLSKAGLSEWPAGFQGRPRDRLRRAELESIYLGRPHEEISRNGFYATLHDGDGNWRLVATGNRARVLLSGTLAIKGDRLCWRSDAIHMGREYCSEVYRNPNGSPETNDAYVRVNPDGVWRFSIRPVEKQ